MTFLSNRGVSLEQFCRDFVAAYFLLLIVLISDIGTSENEIVVATKLLQLPSILLEQPVSEAQSNGRL